MTTEIKLQGKGGVLNILQDGNSFTVSNSAGELIESREFKTELTARAYLNFLLLFFTDLGYKRVV